MIVLETGFDPADVDDPPGTPWIGWHNIVALGNVTSDTEDDEHPASNLANPATHLFWRGGTNTALDEHVTVTTGTTDEINYVAIAKHNFGSEAFTVSLEATIIGMSPDVWVTVIDEFTPDDDLPIIMRFSPINANDIRVRLQGGDDLPQAAVIYAGTLLLLERGLDPETKHVPLTYGRRNTIANGMSDSGNFTGRIKLKEWRESTATFSHFTPDWYRTNFEPFVEQAE